MSHLCEDLVQTYYEHGGDKSDIVILIVTHDGDIESR